ncbi:magnesium-transporting ATPase [Vagococcus martis]|uniref:Magnesium-transporting ATPase n=1 Tax=Vagococcus martis TaxID=1768210 RepID=A0A1V4DK14_9ENTE|nr:HAD-IC family P-type ATPase [Vagococcus martis]OPF88550.1 magnesium-transporting ATPase [Vagococcus martis]
MSKRKSYPGLTDEEVLNRIARGEVNQAIPKTTRSLKQIVFENSFTLFNFINLVIAGFIVYTGSYKNLLFLGVIITNTLVGVYQEIKAKNNIDRLSLLSESKVSVIRNYKVLEIPQNEVVKDDLINIKRGQQIVVDGIVLDTEGMECDESQLTGESDPIIKTNGSEVYSGSFIVSGSGLMQATHVGKDSYSYKLSIEAKQTKGIYSELIMMMNRLIRLLTMVIIPIGAILMITSLTSGTQLNEAILGSTAAIMGMIPEGLILLTTVALAVGVIKLSRRQVLVQTMGAIETLARVDVLCLDKTGTLTSGQLKVVEFDTVDENHLSKETFSAMIGSMVKGLDEDNATGLALMDYFNEVDEQLIPSKQIPFSSARKWSAITFKNDYTYFMGAPEYLFDDFSEAQTAKMSEAFSHGLRIIAITRSQVDEATTVLPNDLELLGFIYLEDEIRPEAPQTLEYFKQEKVDICIISGDHPETVAQIAKRSGVSHDEESIDMSKIPDDKIPEVVKTHRIFGRVSPEQKKKLVTALQDDHHVVGMTGDGVNDILALKQADCSIVMANGSDAAKGIADFVLLDSNFDSMIDVVLEGRQVINNIQRVSSLYLTKTVYSLFLAAIFIFVSSPYPFQPIQLSPINALTVGIPSFFLALRPNTQPIKGMFLKNVFEPPLASGLTVVITTLLIEVFGNVLGWSYEEKSTVTVLLAGFIGFIVLREISKPLTTKINVLLSALLLFFLCLFTFFDRIFSLVNLYNIKLAIVYIPLMLLAILIFYTIRWLVKKIFRE